jgi:soluble lytic murein transglycosylase-like protein
MKKAKSYLFILSFFVTFLLLNLFLIERADDIEFNESLEEDEIIRSSPSVQMYFYIKKYAKKYGVPEGYAFAIAYHETRYQGPLHFEYDHKRTSSSGAVGPMQIIPKYAHKYAGRKVSEKELMENIELNVKISMQMLKKWYTIYKNWGIAAGAYNTGQPIINSYARSIINEEYKWIKI